MRKPRSQVLEGSQPWIRRALGALALDHIPVAAANLAEPKTAFAAQRLHGERQGRLGGFLPAGTEQSQPDLVAGPVAADEAGEVLAVAELVVVVLEEDGVAAEAEYVSDDLLLIHRTVFVGGPVLAQYAEREDGQFKVWLPDTENDEPFWQLVTGIAAPPVMQYSIENLGT